MPARNGRENRDHRDNDHQLDQRESMLQAWHGEARLDFD